MNFLLRSNFVNYFVPQTKVLPDLSVAIVLSIYVNVAGSCFPIRRVGRVNWLIIFDTIFDLCKTH